MNLQEKKSVITQLYAIYDAYISTKKLACQRRCAGCCTINVTMTSIEGHLLFSQLKSERQDSVFDKLAVAAETTRFQPTKSPNGMVAEIMDNHDTPPDEPNNPEWGVCPLLVDAQCSAYDNRPFECRSFVSTSNCLESKAADMPEEIIAVNNIFKQYIEHTDADGYTANLTDMLLYLDTQRKRHLVRNQPIPALMADPHFKNELEPLIDQIQNIRIKI